MIRRVQNGFDLPFTPFSKIKIYPQSHKILLKITSPRKVLHNRNPISIFPNTQNCINFFQVWSNKFSLKTIKLHSPKLNNPWNTVQWANERTNTTPHYHSYKFHIPSKRGNQQVYVEVWIKFYGRWKFAHTEKQNKTTQRYSIIKKFPKKLNNIFTENFFIPVEYLKL